MAGSLSSTPFQFLGGPAPGTAAAVGLLRTRVPGPGPDRWLSPELAAAEQMLATESLATAVEAATGRLV